MYISNRDKPSSLFSYGVMAMVYGSIKRISILSFPGSERTVGMGFARVEDVVVYVVFFIPVYFTSVEITTNDDENVKMMRARTKRREEDEGRRER